MIFKIISWLWAGFVVFSYLTEHPISVGSIGFRTLILPGMLEFAFGLAFVGLAWLAGLSILRKAGCGTASLASAAGALPAGLLVTSLAGATLSLLFSLQTAFIGTLCVLAWAASIAIRDQELRIAASRLKRLFADCTFSVAFFTVIALSLLNLPGLVAPATAYDDQVYQLTIPRLYSESGGIRHLPELPPANRPQNIHVAYMFLGSISGNTAMRTISWAFGLATSILLAVVVGLRIGPFAGALAAIAWQTHPELALIARTAYTDLPVTYLLLATVFLLSELRSKEPSTVLPSLSVVASFAGGVKTSGLGILFLALVASPIILCLRPDWKENQNSRLLLLLKFSLVTCLLGFPWYLRNWYVTGNPIYPHMGYLWNFTRFTPVAIAAFDRVFHVPLPFTYDHRLLLDRFGMGHDPLAMLLLPWNVTIHSHVHDAVYSLMHFDGEIGFLPLALAPLLALAFFERKKHPEHAALAVITLAAFVLWGAGSQQIRFLLPILGLAAALCGFRMNSAYADKRLVLVLSLASVLHCASFSMSRNLKLEPWILGKESSEQYLSRELPFFRAYSWFNANAQPGDKLLPLFEERVYYLSRPFQWMELVPFPFISALMAADGSNRVVEYLRAFGISHLYLPSQGQIFLREIQLDRGYLEKLTRFFSVNSTVVYSDKYGSVYRLAK